MRHAGWFMVLLACGTPRETCDVEAIVATMAGEGARDCGLVEAGDDAEQQTCLAEAWQQGAAFHGLAQEVFETHLLVRGPVSDGVEVWWVLADFYACTDSGCRGKVERFACETFGLTSDGGVTCSLPTPTCGEPLCGTLTAVGDRACEDGA